MSGFKYAIAILKEKLSNADEHNLQYQRLSIADMEAIWGVLSNCESDYSELKAERDALAAENATIKTMNDVLSEELRGYESDGAYDGPIAHKLWHSNSETPATDAYLNSVRAEGVEMVKAHPAISLCSLTHVCEEIASQLLAGEPS